MTKEEINFEELQEIVNSPLKNKRTIKDFVKTIFDLSNKNKQLKKENKELNRDKTELVNSVTELKTKVTELEMQIERLEEDKGQIIFESDLTIKALEEKMKCCGNCKHSIITDDWNVKCPISDLDTWDNYKCKNWELAE